MPPSKSPGSLKFASCVWPRRLRACLPLVLCPFLLPPPSPSPLLALLCLFIRSRFGCTEGEILHLHLFLFCFAPRSVPLLLLRSPILLAPFSRGLPLAVLRTFEGFTFRCCRRCARIGAGGGLHLPLSSPLCADSSRGSKRS